MNSKVSQDDLATGAPQEGPKLVRNARRRSRPALGGDLLPRVIVSEDPERPLVEWIRDHSEEWEQEMNRSGAVLFRGFGIEGEQDFARLLPRLCGDSFGDYGDLPHAAIEDGVYQSSPYPENESILLHGEGAHLSRWPLRICFFCDVPPARGGETTLLEAGTMWELLDDDLREALEQKGVSYLRNFLPHVDRSWQSVFGTSDRESVERTCAQSGIECEWVGEDSLRTILTVPVRTPHPHGGERQFFHQLLLFHPMGLPAEVRDSLRSLFSPSELPRNVTFGDGTPIPDDRVERFRNACEERTSAVSWRRGDVLLVDNMRVAHGRRPFEGDRRILVGMGGTGERTR